MNKIIISKELLMNAIKELEKGNGVTDWLQILFDSNMLTSNQTTISIRCMHKKMRNRVVSVTYAIDMRVMESICPEFYYHTVPTDKAGQMIAACNALLTPAEPVVFESVLEQKRFHLVQLTVEEFERITNGKTNGHD